jgi:hypothetical protein
MAEEQKISGTLIEIACRFADLSFEDEDYYFTFQNMRSQVFQQWLE